MTKLLKYGYIGGGPAGLVTAKTLLHDFPDGRYEPFIFERKHGVGGLWNVSPQTTSDDIVAPDMPTNISRYTCAFSDLAWESVDLGEDGLDPDAALPMFPKARHVKRYLETYAKWYIPSKNVGLGFNVLQAQQYDHGGATRWSVEWEVAPSAAVPCSTSPIGTKWTPAESGPGRYKATFDYLVVASGFFAALKTLDVPGVQTFSQTAKMRHSSKLRNVEDDLVDGGSGKIVVVGGSMSGVEAAATVAFQLSSNKYSPATSKNYSGYTLHHLTSRPFWVLPPHALAGQTPDGAKGSAASTKPSFLPTELVGNDLSGRAEDVVSYRPSKQVVLASIKLKNTGISKLLGTNQKALGDGVLSFDGERMATQLPWIAVSPTYAEFVRSGDINVNLGSIVKIHSSTLIADGEIPFQLDNVTLLISATGFDPHSSLSFLPPEVLQSMNYKPDDNYEPLSIDEFAVTNAAQPQLGFVGFYLGPYFGIMEMQARYLGKLWSGEHDDSNTTGGDDGQRPVSTDEKLPRAQFPMADYLGLMESLARKTGVRRIPIPGLPEHNAHGQGVVVASRYPSSHISEKGAEEVTKTLQSLARTLGIAGPTNANVPNVSLSRPNLAFLAPATFRALQGGWHLHRVLTSALAEYPSGIFRGTASFHPREPTSPEYAAEMLYMEDGELTTQQGFVMRGRRRYVYRLQEGVGISSWFVKADGLTVDYLFHVLAFEADEGEEEGWKAVGSSHLCVDDNYESEYRFCFDGIDVKQWQLGYQVKGPKKDYFTKSTSTRS